MAAIQDDRRKRVHASIRRALSDIGNIACKAVDRFLDDGATDADLTTDVLGILLQCHEVAADSLRKRLTAIERSN